MWNKVKKHLLTGISYMIPLVAAGGLLQAIAKIFGGALVGEAVGTVPYMINSMGSAAMSLVVPVICAYVAYSIADRAAIAPGLILGLVCVEIKSGFIGGVIAAFLVGYFILFLKKYLKVPSWMQGPYAGTDYSIVIYFNSWLSNVFNSRNSVGKINGSDIKLDE